MDERERNQYDYERRGYENRVSPEAKKRRIWGGVLAALLVLAGIWGWNASHRDRVGYEQQQVQQRTSAVRGGYNVGENRKIATTTGQARVIKVDKNAIEK